MPWDETKSAPNSVQNGSMIEENLDVGRRWAEGHTNLTGSYLLVCKMHKNCKQVLTGFS